MVYSHFQACGIINDHGCDCPRYAVVNAEPPSVNCVFVAAETRKYDIMHGSTDLQSRVQETNMTDRLFNPDYRDMIECLLREGVDEEWIGQR